MVRKLNYQIVELKKMNLLRYYKDNGDLIEITVDQIQEMLQSRKKDVLSEFIYNRFYYRYIKPFEFKSTNIITNPSGRKVNEYSLLYKNGFSIMANCCLLIEALESFYRGWPNSHGKSETAFLKFFTRDKNFHEFSTDDMPTVFYKSIRCGILHQGETTNGWRITRDEDENLLDKENRKINANKFSEGLKKSIEDYRGELLKMDWGDEIWKKAKIKIEAIIKATNN